MASKNRTNMDSTFPQSATRAEPSSRHTPSEVSHQSSAAHKAPRAMDRSDDLSTVFVYPPLVKGPILGMSEEQHAVMMQKGDHKLPSTPPGNGENGEGRPASSQSLSPKPFQICGMTSSDAGSSSLCELHILEDTATFEMETIELQKIQRDLLSGDFKVHFSLCQRTTLEG